MQDFNIRDTPSIFNYRFGHPSLEDESAWQAYLAHKPRLDEFLNTLTGPVFAVDEDGRVMSANQKAYDTLGKTAADVDGELGGDVFECRFANLPRGCGHTYYCPDCTIRHLVNLTRQDNINFYSSIAFLRRHQHEFKLRLSTQRIANLVLLRIEDMQPVS